MAPASSLANLQEAITCSCSASSDSLSPKSSRQVEPRILKDSNSKVNKTGHGKISGQWTVPFMLAGIALTWIHKQPRLNNSESVERMKQLAL